MQRLTSRLRVVSVILSITLAASAVIARVHQASVQHAYCAEHGVVEDRPSGDPSGEVQVAAEHALDGDETGNPGRRDQHQTDHEACAFALALQPGRTIDRGPALFEALNEQALQPASPADTVPADRSVLSIAPKTSPPLGRAS